MGQAATQWTRRSALSGIAAAASRVTSEGAVLRLPRKVRLAMAGFEGHIAEILTPLKQLPDLELAAYVIPEAGERTPRLPEGAKPYASLAEMLAHEQLDIVSLCGRNDTRAAEAIACARRGVHIVAEKPLALTGESLHRLRRAVEESRVRLTMLLPMRFSPPYLALKQIVASGEIGEVAQIHAQKSYQVGERAAWMKKHSSFGGTIPYIGIHMVDLMRWVSGREMSEVMSYQAHLGSAESGEMEDTTGSLFRLDNGGVGVLHMDYLRPKAAGSHGDDRLRLAGTRGIAEYQEATGVTLTTDEKRPHRIEKLPEEQSLFADFLAAVYLGRKAMLSIEDVWRVNEIVLAARTSGETRMPVRL